MTAGGHLGVIFFIGVGTIENRSANVLQNGLRLQGGVFLFFRLRQQVSGPGFRFSGISEVVIVKANF